MKAYRGKTSITPLIVNLGTRWRLVDSCTLRPFNPQGKSRRYTYIGGWVGVEER
jgi:hypothetical protein